MQTIKRNQFSLRLLPWLAALVWLPQARAILPPERPPLPNYDKRPTAASTAKSEQNAAAKALQGSVPGAKVDFDAVTGAPAWVRNETGFLTGPGGKGGGISAASLAARPADDPHRVLKAFLTEHAKLFGHGAEALAAARVKREFPTAHNGLKTVVWEQQVDDIPLFQGLLIAHTTKQGELVSVSSGFLPDPVAAADRGTPKRVALQASPAVAAAQAVALAAQDIGEVLTREQVSAVEAEAQGPTRQQHFRAPGLNGETTAQLVWLPLSGASLRLCWDVMLTSRARGEMFRLLVDAETGEVLVRHCLTSYISDATYRVYTSDSPSPFSPGWSTPNSGQPPVISRTLLTLSALDTNASPNGWIDDGVSETIGNNVDAHTDRNNDNQPDLPRPQGGTGRVFDFPMDLSTQDPTSYSQAAVVQLFYWNNWMHDRLYQLGFTEAAGNFQSNNFGRGGLGNDAVKADAQDGGGTDNANFSTPPDGYAPRMQMYIFTGASPRRDGDLDAEVVLHEHTHGLSNRRVGGGVGISALQTGGMGEGWSDFYALTLLSEAGDDLNGVYPNGGYVTYLLAGMTQNYYFGIRRYPYCTDLTKNPLTFKDIDPGQASSHTGVPRSPIVGNTANEVHNMGEVWCVTLWEARAKLVAKYGWVAGNQLILQLVTDGMNLSPANPNFLQARDAVLQADQVDTGGANRNELWAAFAKRGMGASATSPASSTASGVVEAFDVPDDLFISPAFASASGPVGGPFSPNPVTFTLTNTGGTPLSWSLASTSSWLTVSPASGTLAPGGPAVLVNISVQAAANTFPLGAYRAGIWFTNQTSGVAQSRPFTLYVVGRNLFDNFDPGINLSLWSSFGGIVGSTVLATNYGGSVSPPNSLWFGDDGSRYATTIPIDTSTGGAISFYLRLAQGSAWPWETVDLPGEGIVLEYSRDNGVTWTTAGTYNTSAYYNWTHVTLPIPTGAQGPTVEFRWRQLSHSGSAFDHWALDDVAIDAGPMPPTIYSQPQSQAVVVGDSVTLDISAWGSQPMSYQWLFNGTNLSGATTSCLAFTNVQLADAGTYAVFLSNSIATLLSSNAVLTVSPPPPCVPPPSGLASWWRGEGDASDAVGGRNGALSGGVSFPSGKVGQAFSLNGVDGEVDLGSWFNLQVFSVALWVKANPSQNSSADIMDNNHTDYRSWVVQYNNTGLQFFWYSGNFGKIYFSLTPNTWQYLVITLETNYVARVYLDGQLQGSIAGTGPLTYDGTQFLRLGRWGSGGRYFNGALDEVDVYNRALTAAEITALYTAGKSGKCVTPVGPAILSQPADQVALVGGTATFAVTASGTPPLSYQWTLNGTNLTRATNNPLVLTNVQFSQAGLYAVLVTNLYGSVLSSNASLTVTAVPPAIVTQPLSQTVPVGTNAAFSVVVTGTPPLSYQWTLNGTNLTRATNNPLVLTNVQFSQAGLYAVLVTNFYGSVLSSNATLTVVAGLDTFYVANSGNNTVEKITASGASVFANTNLSNPQGVVRDSGGNLYVANYGNNTIAKFTPDGVGSVFAGAGLSGPVGLAIDGADNLYVANQRNGTILKFTPGGVSSTFATGVSGATGLALDTSGNLYVTASPGNILKFTPAGVRSTFASGLSSPTFLVVDSAGNVYVATLGPNNIQKFTPAGVGTVFAGTNLSGPYGMVFDSAGNLYVANSGNNTIARFTPAGVGSVFASTGLSIPIGLAFAPGLTPAVPPAITLQPQSQVVPAGSYVSFTVAATGTAPLSYQWRFNETNLAGQTTSALALVNVQSNAAGNYSVLVTNLYGSALSSNAMLTVNPPPPCLPPPAGLVSWWRGEGDATDAVGGHNGTLVGGASYRAGKVGQAFALNGVDGEVDLGSWFNLQTFSVALWVNASASQSTSADIMDNNHTDYRSWVVQYNNSGLQFFWYSGNLGKLYFSLTPDTWQYLVITLDSNYVARVYLDGQLQGSIAGTGPLTYDGTQFVRLGRWGSGGRYFNGLLDEVDVYNRALSPAEVTALYNAGAGGKCVNHPPTAANLAAATQQNQPFSLPVEKLLLLASDPDGDPLTLSAVSSTSTNGAPISLVTDSIIYTPLTNFIGADCFTYTVNDGRGGTASAYVLVQVRSRDVGSGNMLPLQPIPGGFLVSFAGVPGRAYTLQRAAAVTGPWISLGTVPVDFSGIASYADTNAPPANAYYRTVYLQP